MFAYDSDYSFLDMETAEPKPEFAAYRAMTHRLEHSRYVADLSGTEYEAYLFDRNGTAVTVLWSKAPVKAKLPFGTPTVTQINLMDNATTLGSR